MTLHCWMTLSAGVGLLLIGVTVTTHTSLDAQEKKPEARDKSAKADAENPFADKIVMIYEKDDASKAGVGFVIKNVAFDQIKGVWFIVGKMRRRTGGSKSWPDMSPVLRSTTSAQSSNSKISTTTRRSPRSLSHAAE